MQKSNHIKSILPGQTIGIIGGGQLGRMMAIAAKYMGYQIAVLDPTPNCPTSSVADQQITAAYDDMDAIKRLTEISDVVTYEFENVDLKAATYIEKQGKLPQGAYALEITQNREKEKQLMKGLNLPVPSFQVVTNAKECEEALKSIPFPSVIKTCRGGYDGKGQIKLLSPEDAQTATRFTEKNKHCIIEQWVTFDKEISSVFTRSGDGTIKFFPIAENVHKDHILYQTIAPATMSDAVKEKVEKAATALANEINIVGTFAIEMFVRDEDIYLNEMAPRPHNSGHYTIEACSASQFTQHIRAICGLDLFNVQQLQHARMINILGENLEYVLRKMPSMVNGFVHLYGKDEAKPKRKMSHITFIANTDGEVSQFVQAYESGKQ